MPAVLSLPCVVGRRRHSSIPTSLAAVGHCVTVWARATSAPVTHTVPPPLRHSQAWLLSGCCLTFLRSALRSAQLRWVTPCSAAATR